MYKQYITVVLLQCCGDSQTDCVSGTVKLQEAVFPFLTFWAHNAIQALVIKYVRGTSDSWNFGHSTKLYNFENGEKKTVLDPG